MSSTASTTETGMPSSAGTSAPTSPTRPTTTSISTSGSTAFSSSKQSRTDDHFTFIHTYNHMATQRTTQLAAIQLPFQRTSQQIAELQLKDKQLHTTILNLRDKIHNSRSSNCRDCKLYEQQIATIKAQEKERAEQLEQALLSLQQENSILAKETKQLYAKQHLLPMEDHAGKECEDKGRLVEIADKADWTSAKQILDQHMFLKDIEDKAVTIQLKEKRQQEILSKMKRKRDPSGRNNEDKNNLVEVSTYSKINYDLPQQLQEHCDPHPEIAQQLKQLREKSAYLEQLCKDYEKSLQEKNEMKEQDSLRIISQLQEIENYKKELQNMDKHYQLQCAQLQQEKERIQYELGSQIKRQEGEIKMLKDGIESSNTTNNNLTQLVQDKHLQAFALNKEISDKEIELKRATASLQALKKDREYKQSQVQELASELSTAESHNSKLASRIEQQKIFSSALQQKTNALCLQMEQLKHRCFALQSQVTNNKGADAGQILYLRNIIQQNGLILQSKVQEINHLQQELRKQQHTQKQLRENLEKISQSAQNNEQLLAQQKEKVANLEKERTMMSRSLQSLEAQKVQAESHLQKETQQKTNFSHKYLLQADKNVQLCQRINALQRELQEYKSNKVAALALKQARDKEFQSLKKEMQQVADFNSQMYNDILSFKEQNASLASQTLHLQTIVRERQKQLLRLKAQNQSLLAQKILLQASNTQTILQSSRIIEQSTSEKQNLLNSIVKLQDDITMNKQLLHQRQFQIEQRDIQAYSQAQRISCLKEELLRQREQQVKLQAMCSQLQNQIKSLNESLKQSAVFHPSKEEHNDETYNLKDIRKKSHQLELLQSQLKQTQAQHSSLIKKHDALLETERKHSENIAYLNEKIDSLNKVYQSATGQSADELVKELNKKKQMITELLTNFKYIEKALSKKESQFDQLNEKYGKLYKASQKRNFQMESKLAVKESQALMLKREKEQESKRNASMFKDMERLTHQLYQDNKNKEKIQNEEKRQIERELARLTEENKKNEQSSSREITHLKESLQAQRKKSQQSSHNSSPVKPDYSKKELQSMKKEIAEKNAKISQLQKQLGDKDSELSALKQINSDNQAHIKEVSDMLTETEVHHDVKEHQLQKSKQLVQQLEQQIVCLKAQLANRQAKYHQLQNEDTQKNLANDFLWVQLQQEKNKVRKLQGKTKESGSLKMIKQQSLEIIVNSDQSFFNLNSAVELPNMESIKQEKEKEQAVDLPFTIKQEVQDQGAQTNVKQTEEQVPLMQKKSSSKNILFQNTLSDALSDSQQNDEINQMIKKDSDSKSHLQSSIEAFSEYSRIKSTKSQLTHKQVEQHYKSKMKSTMLLAKLGKKAKKK